MKHPPSRDLHLMALDAPLVLASCFHLHPISFQRPHVYAAKTRKDISQSSLLPHLGIMETKINGVHASGSSPSSSSHNGFQFSDGLLIKGHEDEPSLEEREREIPVIYDGQIPLAELLSRMMQAIYAELTEMAETRVEFDSQVHSPTKLTFK